MAIGTRWELRRAGLVKASLSLCPRQVPLSSSFGELSLTPYPNRLAVFDELKKQGRRSAAAVVYRQAVITKYTAAKRVRVEDTDTDTVALTTRDDDVMRRGRLDLIRHLNKLTTTLTRYPCDAIMNQLSSFDTRFS